MVPHSITLSDPEPKFQGHDNIQRQITRLIVYDMIYPMFPFPVTLSDP